MNLAELRAEVRTMLRDSYPEEARLFSDADINRIIDRIWVELERMHAEQAGAKRLCGKCGQQIRRRHKFFFAKDGRIYHRNCEDPESFGDNKGGGADARGAA